ncbi:MAG: phage integrase N-terminal SAM-like domain-containing protein [Anaerolineales bacterium]
MDQVSDALRTKHYSYRTEQTYVDWIKRYIYFHNKRHPSEMGAPEIQAFLTHLASERSVAAAKYKNCSIHTAKRRAHPFHKFLPITREAMFLDTGERSSILLGSEGPFDGREAAVFQTNTLPDSKHSVICPLL